MIKFVLGRLLQAIGTMWLMTLLVFGLSSLTGDEIDFLVPYEEGLTLEQIEDLKKAYGLDKSRFERYVEYMSQVLRGDLGFSRLENRRVTSVIRDRLGATFQLGLAVALASVIIAIPIGVLSAVKRGTWMDFVARVLALLGQAVPTFWLALILILVFGVWLSLLPVAGRGGITSFILPVIAIMGFSTAGLMRITRSAMLEILDSEYIKLARAKGASRTSVVWKHAFKNALIPVVTYIGLMLAGLLNGTIIAEIIFAWPGLGRVALAAVQERDTVLLQGVVLFITALYLVMAYFIDMTYALIDPRIRYK